MADEEEQTYTETVDEVLEEEEEEEEPEPEPEPQPPKPSPAKQHGSAAAYRNIPSHEKVKSKISASRKLHLKILMLGKAKEDLDKENMEREEEKKKYLSERAHSLHFAGLSLAALQELCKELHQKAHIVDEERYDIEAKVNHNAAQIHNLNLKILDLRGKFKKPNLRRVRVSADAMLHALLGSKHKVSLDLRANLKSVKKDESEKVLPLEVGDWRKNVEAMSGMEGRKKCSMQELQLGSNPLERFLLAECFSRQSYCLLCWNASSYYKKMSWTVRWKNYMNVYKNTHCIKHKMCNRAWK
ncbi:troponin I, slow skeletal muscle-like isoform X1 [Protopterus annectens]|uniref:troponin I, slow skeletal muscle-like isoform X1 n=1 Tax=Protopterus annectens TaxID=7888 RepID=UPI001CF9580A|nr:troponin I, slow skeletal muscle-like isoform X1 [Protopterus annectens]